MDTTHYIVDIDKKNTLSSHFIYNELTKYFSPQFIEVLGEDISRSIQKEAGAHPAVKESVIFHKENGKALHCRLTAYEDWKAIEEFNAEHPNFSYEDNFNEYGAIFQSTAKDNEFAMVAPNGRYSNITEYKLDPKTNELKTLLVSKNRDLGEDDYSHPYLESVEYTIIKPNEYSIRILDELPDRSTPFYRCSTFNNLEGFGCYTRQYFLQQSFKLSTASKVMPLYASIDITLENGKAFKLSILDKNIVAIRDHKETIKFETIEEALSFIANDSATLDTIKSCPSFKTYLDRFIDAYKNTRTTNSQTNASQFKHRPNFILDYLMQKYENEF